MNNQQAAPEPRRCSTCQRKTEERCSYCLLPLCVEHGQRVQPWFTRRWVMVCHPCQIRLEEIAGQDQHLQGAARTEQHPAH